VRGSSRRLRVLVLAPFTPQSEGRHGGARAIAGIVEPVARRHDVGLLHLSNPPGGAPDPRLLETCAFVEGLPSDEPSGTGRWLRRVAVNGGLLRGVPIWAGELASSQVAARVADVSARWRPDIVQVEFLPMAVFVTALRSRAPCVLVDHDASSRPAHEFGHLPTPLRRPLKALDAHAWRRFDGRTAARVDATVVFTEADRTALEHVSPRRIVRIPLVVPPRARPLNPVGRRPPSVLFAGYYRHSPNADAARWLVHEIFPRVRREHPEAELVLVGEEPPADLRQPDEGVVVVGAVDDVTEYLERAAVVVAPIRSGGGVRVKVLEALGAGKAVVATHLAAEGIDAPPDALLLADSAAEFAGRVSLLLGDEQRRRALAESAYSWACRHLRAEATAEGFDRLYTELLDGR
jgi:glycosyltransferase involved in cell wall biosynthesis